MSWTEANFKTELQIAFEKAGHVCWKFPDIARGLKKPCDLVAGIEGRFVAIESKVTKVGTTENPGRWHDEQIIVRQVDVRLNQHTALRLTERRGSVALVIGAIYDRYDYDRQAYALPYHEFMERDVWTLADCRRLAIPIRWEKGHGWDVEELVRSATEK